MQTASSFRLNADLIENCNNENDFNTGDVIAAEAENTYKGFDNMVKSFGELNKRQSAYIESRRVEWKNLVEQVYNDELTRRAKIVLLYAKLKHRLTGGQKLNEFITDTVKKLKRLSE